MKAIYNDNLTIETCDDANKRNLRECRALQEAVEGKALVIGGGITPIKQNDPLHDGVSHGERGNQSGHHPGYDGRLPHCQDQLRTGLPG